MLPLSKQSINIEERRPSRSVSRARDEASARAARERRGDDAINRALKLAENEGKRQRDEADAASGVRNMQQPTAEAFFELFRKAADGLTPATTAVVDMHRADVPEAIPLVQLIPFKPQIGKDGEPLTQPVASVAHDDATQKFLRQNWDLQRQFSTNGALRDAELARLSPPLLLRGTPADAKKRIEGLRDRLKTSIASKPRKIRSRSSCRRAGRSMSRSQRSLRSPPRHWVRKWSCVRIKLPGCQQVPKWNLQSEVSGLFRPAKHCPYFRDVTKH